MYVEQYADENTKDATHVVDLFDLKTGDPLSFDGRNMFVEVKSAKSKEWEKEIDAQRAYEKRTGTESETVSQDYNNIARRLAAVTTRAFIAVSPALTIDFDASKMQSGNELDQARAKLRDVFRSYRSVITVPVLNAVVKDSNFIQGLPASSLPTSANESGITQSPAIAS